MQNTIRLLLVENDAIESPRLRRAFEMLGTLETLVHVTDMGQAWKCLSCSDLQKRPSLIMLDLDANAAKGVEFLKTIKEDPTLQCIPVVVATSSRQSDLMLDSFAIGVAGYIVKPEDDNRLMEAVQAFDRYWTLSHIPTHAC